jgi:hypothetical protein
MTDLLISLFIGYMTIVMTLQKHLYGKALLHNPLYGV